jgi:hypothetical protein
MISIEDRVMTTRQVEANANPSQYSETQEVKQPMQYHPVDESLSEWEAARLTSKTWSMEQD